MARKPSRAELESQISVLKGQLDLKGAQHTQELTAKESAFTTEKAELEARVDGLETQISELEGVVDEKQGQLNQQELKKLAQAYRDQEAEYQKEADDWFKWAVWSFVAVAASFALSLWLGEGKLWYDKIEYHVINFLTITALVFSMRQFSHFNKLRIDFANRKAMAQAYHNIFTSIDDVVIKERFLDKAIEVLCARPEHKPDANTIPEKLLESITEIAKNLSKS